MEGGGSFERSRRVEGGGKFWKKSEGGGWKVLEAVGGWRVGGSGWEWVGGSGEIVALFLGVECVLPKKKLCYNCGRIKRFWDCRMISFCLRMFAGLHGWIVRAFCAGCLAAALLLSATGEAVAQQAKSCGSEIRGMCLGTLCVSKTGDDFGVTHHELCEGFGGTRQTVYAEGVTPDEALSANARGVIARAESSLAEFPFCAFLTKPMQDAVRGWAVGADGYFDHLEPHTSNDDYANCLNLFASDITYDPNLGRPITRCGNLPTPKERFDCLFDNYVGKTVGYVSPEWCLYLDQSGTVCLLGSVNLFPCRGLLKHLRTCNLQYNRRALNPFICGAQCQSGRARGAECPTQ